MTLVLDRPKAVSGAEVSYRQCRMRQGNAETVGWIEARGARVGARVALLELGGLWEVVAVYHPTIAGRTLRLKQQMDRSPFGSIL